MLTQPQTILKEATTIDAFFGTASKEVYNKYIEKTTRCIDSFLENNNFYSGETPSNLRSKGKMIKAEAEIALSLDEALSEIKELYLDHAISFHNPNYVAHLNCPVLIPALVGDMIASAVNTAVETWDQSTSATLIEQEMIRWINTIIGYDCHADGVFTSGGTQSNFMALLMARDHYAYKNYGINIKQNGWSEVVSKFRIFCSEKAHFSMKKNAALLGMGYDAVIPVKTDERMKMDASSLVFEIEREKQKGNIPIAIVATVGTTDFGSFDPIQVISKIAKEEDVWFHIDGAYGGCYKLTETHKKVLEGMEFADSITVDFHKTFFQPVCSSAFLAKNKQYFQYVSYYADYLNPLENRNDKCPDLIEKSIQTTRRFDALKLWFTLKMTSESTLASYLEKVHFLALDLYHSLKDDPCFELIHKPELSTLVFRYKVHGIHDDQLQDTVNLYIKNTLFKTGQASVASTKYEGKIFLKFTLLNPSSTIQDLLNIIGMIKEKGKEYRTSN
ncbi:pyridoxal phosphate-dependent decarboxylase family protein [Aquimarina agarivorans]|uniref:pyridoxal phosphate-dependent decarboxylase family protein n=1 Tax=Aquimarina agarivorans TaxID=980584 RepID=UPI000248ED26|nr:pyridoxal-dependent decarboxylase [Aquimarina agarivorans]